jgi:nucleotide-binding universal stress UspA family protein
MGSGTPAAATNQRHTLSRQVRTIPALKRIGTELAMKQMIAALDLSPISDEVVNCAASIARAFSARLVLLHVAAPDPDFVGFDVGPQSVRDARAHELRDEHRAFQQLAHVLRDSGVNAEAGLVQGPTVDTILEQAERQKADLLIVGSHGHGAVYRALLGSVSEGVLHRSKIPVLIIPARSAEPHKAL